MEIQTDTMFKAVSRLESKLERDQTEVNKSILKMTFFFLIPVKYWFILQRAFNFVTAVSQCKERLLSRVAHKYFTNNCFF